MLKNVLYAQSGGVTSVINASACGVIETVRKARARGGPRTIGKVLAGQNGILGILRETLIDTSRESRQAIAALRHTPGGAFGSCRYKLQALEDNESEYLRLIEVFKAHDIDCFFYNGGGDSQDTANKIAIFSQKKGYPVICIGIPKTVDNDLPLTDNCPGFGSVAKYVAVSTLEAGLDVASMAGPLTGSATGSAADASTRVFVLEVMGRHAGWIAAAAGLAGQSRLAPPHIILFPEIAFDRQKFLSAVRASVEKVGYCVVVASEGVRLPGGKFLAEAGRTDAFGHAQLGGVAPGLVEMIRATHGYKCHWALADYLQRAARHLASATDVAQAYAVGKAAVDFALAGRNAVMPIIIRQPGATYRWKIGEVPLSRVANVERKLPRSFITRDGFGITARARRYLAPLIKGEDYPPYQNGLPGYVRLRQQLVPKKLPPYKP